MGSKFEVGLSRVRFLLLNIKILCNRNRIDVTCFYVMFEALVLIAYIDWLA